MNARLDYETGFLAAVYWQDRVLFNHYHLNIKLRTVSMDSHEHNIALDRIRYVVDNMMTNSVFVHESDRTAIKKLESAGITVVSLPEIPVDQIVGMMLFCKFTAVVEDRMEIGQLSLSSSLGDGIVYHQDASESVGPFEALGWWRDPDPQAQKPVAANGKVVKLQRTPTWQDLDLHWDEKDQPEENTTVVAFRKDDKE
jgi:hypothetical protein